MRSKASFRGHPSHPALIPFPIEAICSSDGSGKPEKKPSFRRRWVPGGCLGKVPAQQPVATFRQLQTNMN